jgi:acetate kinase
VTTELEDRLKKLIPLAPLHLLHNLAGIEAVRAHRPDLPQVACFDTAFHATLPKLARMTSLPRDIAGKEIRRYGFHGLSYEFIVDDLRRTHGAAVDDQRLIVAHLGNGASIAAIKGGLSIETTMGFSTLAGLPMGTRYGDLDPAIVLYLIMERGMSAEAIQHMLYERSGLLGISGASSDMRELLSQVHRPEVAEAVDYFCARARAYIGSLAATLGGVDCLVFTGGIGANAPKIRARICAGLEFLGIDCDQGRNRAGERTISRDGRKVEIEAFPTDEESMIARHTVALLPQPAVAREA